MVKGIMYNVEFRADAVRLVLEEGRSIISVSKDFGINDQTLRNWINNKKIKRDPEKSKIDELERQLREKQKRIDDLEESTGYKRKINFIP